MQPDDSIATHVSNIEFIVKQLKDMGETITDDCVITQVLRSLPGKYRGFTMAWNLMEANRKIMATLTDLLLQEDATMAMRDDARAAYKAQGEKKKNRDQKAKERNNRDGKNKKYDSSNQKSDQTCWICDKQGHFKRDCPKYKNKASKEEQSSASESTQTKAAFIGTVVKADYADTDYWICDSGASMHMTNKREWFKSFIPEQQKIVIADKTDIWSTGRGRIDIRTHVKGKWVDAELKDVLYVPKLDKNLFSLTAMTRQGYSMDGPAGTIHFTKNNRTDVSAIFDGNFYIMQFVVAETTAGYSAQEEDLHVWHRRFGHVHINA